MKLVFWGHGHDFNVITLAAKWHPDIEFVAIVETNLQENSSLKMNGYNIPVLDAKALLQLEYDYLMLSNSFYRDILVLNFKDKLFDTNKLIIPYVCEIQTKDEAILAVSKLASNAEEIVVRVTGLHSQRTISPMYYDLIDNSVIYEPEIYVELADYTRIRTTELIVKEIIKKNCKGEMAEVGVFRGRFAKIFSKYFPQKKMYLYDTFEGFQECQVSKELAENTICQEWIDWFKDTNIDSVKEYIGNIGNTIFRKGIFPHTIQEEKGEEFCLVSLDADLYEPTIAGLRFFYPRLVEGGYILIHDYNSIDILDNNYVTLCGVKEAVYDYEKELGINLCKVPIADMNGSIVITK